MNYIKKMKSMGFRKTKKPLVIVETNDYRNNIVFSEIKDAETFISEKTNPHDIFIPEMRIILDQKTISTLTTYAWKINRNLTIYLTINNQSFTCFAEDTEAPPVITDGFISPHIEKKDKFVIHNGKLNENFWKDTVNSMPVKYKREILLNQII